MQLNTLTSQRRGWLHEKLQMPLYADTSRTNEYVGSRQSVEAQAELRRPAMRAPTVRSRANLLAVTERTTNVVVPVCVE
jgi:hypothetical protein